MMVSCESQTVQQEKLGSVEVTLFCFHFASRCQMQFPEKETTVSGPATADGRAGAGNPAKAKSTAKEGWVPTLGRLNIHSTVVFPRQ